MSAPFTPAQDAALRAIVAEMIGQALVDSDERISDAIAARIKPVEQCGIFDLAAHLGRLSAQPENVDLILRDDKVSGSVATEHGAVGDAVIKWVRGIMGQGGPIPAESHPKARGASPQALSRDPKGGRP